MFLIFRFLEILDCKVSISLRSPIRIPFLEILSELIRDLKNYELEARIEELESKFAKDLSESTFNEIRELKKLQNIN